MHLVPRLKASPRVSVLVVDDNPFMRAAVARLLTRGARQCMAVESLDAAKMTLLGHVPPVVLTDYSLNQRESGVDLAKCVHGPPALRNLALRLFTGSPP